MIILGIETSCDETAVALIASENGTDIAVLADKTLTQIELHAQYGGVFPNMAKREHAKNLVPLLKEILKETGFLKLKVKSEELKVEEDVQTMLAREPEMLDAFLKFIPTIEKPTIDAIAVTEGPGLEPCLWTGINLARALSLVWDIPVIPVNHMEGHIISALMRRNENPQFQIPNSKQTPNPKNQISNDGAISYTLLAIRYPALALLISGGHTELILIQKPFEYEIIGQTRDDAVGEAFDKVARLLGLPYPGGPQISALAEEARKSEVPSSKLKAKRPETTNLKLKTTNLQTIQLPRPMLNSGDFDFSFSGIKTAVLYLTKKLPALTDSIKGEISLEFENAVIEVLLAKTKAAAECYGARTLILGGGVVANAHIRREFKKLDGAMPQGSPLESGKRPNLGMPLYIPEPKLTTDNALMIAVAGIARAGKAGSLETESLRAKGNLRLGAKLTDTLL